VLGLENSEELPANRDKLAIAPIFTQIKLCWVHL